jgi:outer membrane protein assembly factor BamA
LKQPNSKRNFSCFSIAKIISFIPRILLSLLSLNTSKFTRLKTGRIHFFLLILLLLTLASCHPAQQVERRGGYLLVKNTIKNNNPYLPADELEGFIEQSSLSGWLAPYFRPGIYFYEQSLKGKETKFKLFKRKLLGTKPVILDTLLTDISVGKLQQYIKNKGFYHATVTKSIKYRRKTAIVTYNISSGPPCIVKSFEYVVPDTTMLRFMMSDTANGKLRTGMIYDTYVLDDERTRIANVLRNNSYFNFSLSDINYLVDTTNAGLSAEVELHIRKIKIKIPGTADSTIEIQHPRFYIKDIYITPDADITSQLIPNDTLAYKYHLNKADTAGRMIYILHNNNVKLKPSFLSESLDFAQGDPYSQLSVNRTYKKFISQPIIGSANINMLIQNPGKINPLEKQWLDCNIRLVENKRSNFNLGTEGTNSGGSFGVGVNTSVQNKNIFKGAEVLSFKISASAELQALLKKQFPGSGNEFRYFNALQAGAEISIDFPRLLVPYRSKYLQSAQQGRTSFSAGAGFQITPDFNRRVSTAAWSYKWNKNEKIKNIFTPLELNYVKIFTTDSFQMYLDTLEPQYKSQYTDHLLTILGYSIIFSNVGLSKTNKQYYLRLHTETSGNMLYLIDNLSNQPLAEEGYYKWLGVRYDEYIRFDFDFRRYWKLRYENNIVLRFMGGIVGAYGNSESVPFEKSFYLGGANDMRGWRLRSLGPGAYVDPQNQYDKTGNIMLQTSIEHRFPIYDFLFGALFVDAGNIWLLKPSLDFPDGEFKLNTFYKQIAMDLGVGLRFDFSFFIFRVDAAVPFKSPSVQGEWFNSNEFNFDHLILNFGIGYPF